MDEKIYSKNFMIKKEEQTKKTSKGKKAQKTYKILIVDTEFGTRHLLSNFFNTDGDHLEAIVTGSVGETVKFLWEHKDDLPIDLLLISSNLSGRTSGIDLLEIIRQLGFEIPAFILSNYDVDPEYKRAIHWGVSGLLSKTSDTPDDMAKKIRKYIKERIEFSAKVYIENKREVSPAEDKAEYNYDFLRWRTPRGKLKGVCLGPSAENIEGNNANISEEE